MSVIYKVTAKPWQLKRIGFFNLDGLEDVLYKPVRIPFDSRPLQSIIEMFYNNPEWQKLADFEGLKSIGFEFEDIYDEAQGKMVKKLIITDEVINVLTNWRVQVDFEDKILGFTLSSDAPMFCDANNVLDKYCRKTINKLLEKKYIEKINYTQNA